jgi:CheY-like chemotaxis protein
MWDVLVIDDDGDLAATWARHLGQVLDLRARSVTVPAEAEELVKREGVKVAIIDQEMPGVDGVTLGGRLYEADRRIRRIMLSSKATSIETASAYNIGFDRFIHKNDGLRDLPGAVMTSLIEQDRAITEEIRRGATMVYEEHGGLLRQSVRAMVYLLSVDGLDEEYIVEAEWKSHRQLHAGEEVEESFEMEWERSNTLEFATEQHWLNDTGFDLGKAAKISAAVKREIARRQQTTMSMSSRKTARISRRLTLPTEPDDPGKPHVSARVHQVAPVYRCASVTLVRQCAACGERKMFRALVFLESDRLATRHIDYLSDNTTKVVSTGVMSVG